MRVETYRNLHTGTWSVRALEGPDKGRVINHPNTVCIEDAQFVVQPGGNAKVRAEGKKNVHAFVRGNLKYTTDDPAPERHSPVPTGWSMASYNPYENTSFVDKETGEELGEAEVVVLCIKTGVHYFK